MIANFATPLAPTAASSRRQRAALRRLVVLASISLISACGGISVRHDDETDAGTDVSAAAGKSSTSPSATGTNPDASPPVDAATACARVCTSCPATSPANCSALCSTVLSDATTAGCAAPLTALLRCQDAANAGCATDACPTQNNALTACILEYCDSHTNAGVCVYPL